MLTVVKKKWKLITFVIVMLAIAGVIGTNYYILSQVKPSLTTITAKTGEVTSTLSTTGTIKSATTKNYFAPDKVKVKAVHFKVGDVVNEGDLIATFDMNDLLISIEQAQINLSNAKSTYDENLRKQLEDEEELKQLKRDIVSYKYSIDWLTVDPEIDEDIAKKRRLNDYQSELARAESKRDAIEARLPSEESQERLENAVKLQQLAVEEASKTINENKGGLFAETTGIITELTLVEGASTTSTQPAIVLQQLEDIVVSFNLGKYDVEKVEVGQTATISLGNTSYTGKVSKIAASAKTVQLTSSTSTVVPAEISIDAPDDKLKFGLDVDVDIITYSGKDNVVVPFESLKTDRDGDYVYQVVKDETPTEGEPLYKATKTPVTTGNSSDTNIEILTGVKVGDQIVFNIPPDIEQIPLFTVISTDFDSTGDAPGKNKVDKQVVQQLT